MALNTLTGTVQSTPEARRATNGEWLLQVDFVPPSAARRKPLVARAIKNYGSESTAAWVCQRLAQQLRSVKVVTVSYGTANLRAQRLELGAVEHIQPDVARYIRLPNK